MERNEKTIPDIVPDNILETGTDVTSEKELFRLSTSTSW